MKQGANDSTPIPSKLRLHENSHVIAKIAPKIRIIHIFNPKIIKTDEANFRTLVQSLTGQRARNKGSNSSSTTNNTTIYQPKASGAPQKKMEEQLKGRSVVQESNHVGVWNESNIRIVTPRRKTVSFSDMVQVKGGFPVSRNCDEKVKKEFMGQETYKGENSNNGFSMGGFSDIDGLFQDPSDFSSILSKYSQINMFGGMPWSLS